MRGEKISTTFGEWREDVGLPKTNIPFFGRTIQNHYHMDDRLPGMTPIPGRQIDRVMKDIQFEHWLAWRQRYAQYLRAHPSKLEKYSFVPSPFPRLLSPTEV